MKSDVSYEDLRKALSYDPETGLFTWLVTSRNGWVGKTAGCLKKNRHIAIKLDGKHYQAHRLAWLYMTGVWPDSIIDHEDLDGSNNRWRNLRVATQSQNRCNTLKPLKNNSGFKGVSWYKRTNSWRAQIGIGGRKIALGFFDTPEAAHAAYCKAAAIHHKDFARTN